MRIKKHQGESLAYQVVEPDRYDPGREYPLVVMLHGYASSMDDVARLAPVIDQSSYLYACPNAPITFSVRSGRMAYGWSSPGSLHAELEEEEAQAGELLSGFFSEVFERYRATPGRILLMGFSQGGSLSLRCGLPQPETFAGLASLSGYLPEPKNLAENLPPQRDQPIFIAHGTHDQYVPLREARDTRDFLVDRGYQPRYREYFAMRHEVGPAVLAELVPWIKTVLPTKGSDNSNRET